MCVCCNLGSFPVWSEEKFAQSCLALCDPMAYTVRGILQVRILEWVAFSCTRGSSQPRDRTQVSCTAGRFFDWRSYQGLLVIHSYVDVYMLYLGVYSCIGYYREWSTIPFVTRWESHFLGRLIGSLGVPKERGVWNSQGGRKDKLFFFLYIP